MSVDPDVAVVKQRLRRARARLGVSQREAAERAGISKSVLEKYESRDNMRIPNTRQLFRLAHVYELSIDYLLGRIDGSGVLNAPVAPQVSPPPPTPVQSYC